MRGKACVGRGGLLDAKIRLLPWRSLLTNDSRW